MDIRITTPMIQMMGGEHSRDYASFVHGVTEAFHKIRQHTGLWYALMTFLSANYSLVEIQEHVTRKLMPSVQDARATMRIVDIVKNNSNTWRPIYRTSRIRSSRWTLRYSSTKANVVSGLSLTLGPLIYPKHT